MLAYTADLYAYFRMQLFTGITIVFVLYLLYCIFAGKVKLQKHKVYIPMGIYALLTIVSYALSADGKHDRHGAAPFLLIIFKKIIYF